MKRVSLFIRTECDEKRVRDIVPWSVCLFSRKDRVKRGIF